MNNPDKQVSAMKKFRQMLPFFVEFVKFSAAFAVIIAAALVALHTVSAAALQ